MMRQVSAIHKNAPEHSGLAPRARPASRLLSDLVWRRQTRATTGLLSDLRPMIACDRNIGHRTVALQQLANDFVEGIYPGGFAIAGIVLAVGLS